VLASVPLHQDSGLLVGAACLLRSDEGLSSQSRREAGLASVEAYNHARLWSECSLLRNISGLLRTHKSDLARMPARCESPSVTAMKLNGSAAVLGAAAVFMACAASASATWSAPETFPAPPYYEGPAVAVNARGDMAIAWATRGNPAEPPVSRTSVHLVVRAAHGRLISRRLWRTRRAPGGGISVAIDRRGAVSTPYDSTGAVPAFDSRGAAYVAGICDGVVLRARAHSHRFSVILNRGPVLGLNLSLAGAGLGLASWIGGACTSDAGAGRRSVRYSLTCYRRAGSRTL
jgi:hypothetical protein